MARAAWSWRWNKAPALTGGSYTLLVEDVLFFRAFSVCSPHSVALLLPPPPPSPPLFPAAPNLRLHGLDRWAGSCMPSRRHEPQGAAVHDDCTHIQSRQDRDAIRYRQDQIMGARLRTGLAQGGRAAHGVDQFLGHAATGTAAV